MLVVVQEAGDVLRAAGATGKAHGRERRLSAAGAGAETRREGRSERAGALGGVRRRGSERGDRRRRRGARTRTVERARARDAKGRRSAASVAACAKAAEQLNGEGRVSDGRTSTAATTTAGPRPGRRRRASAPRTSSRSASEDESSPRRRSRAFTGPESGRERSRGSALYPAEKPRGRAPRSSRASRDDEAPDGFRPSIRVQQNRRRPRPPAEVPRRSDRRARRVLARRARSEFRASEVALRFFRRRHFRCFARLHS